MSQPALAVQQFDAPQTPRGLIRVNGDLRVRRAGFRDQRELTCYNGHKLHIGRDRRIVVGAALCGHREPPGLTPCQARAYIMRLQAGIVFAMDLTEDEDRMITLETMDLDDIVDYFGISFSPAR